MQDYTDICFVVMPYGTKEIKIKKEQNIFWFTISKTKKIKIDFDYIYDNIFKKAISNVKLPEGGYLKPRRVDKDFFSSIIDKEMFEYLEYSRIALVDITGLNPNVFYELGVRHRAQSTGTAIFRLLDAPIPFDINHIKAFPYQYEPTKYINESIKNIEKILINSLENNKLDSPVQLTLRSQQGKSSVESLLLDAENALRNNDLPTALNKYKNALNFDNKNILIRMKIGIINKELGNWQEALEEFKKVTNISPLYSDAFKERGIAENKLYSKNPKQQFSDNGESSLRKAIQLNNKDFDSYSSLGGILKRKGELKEALECYNKATDISNGHPYPLLNSIKIEAKLHGKISINDTVRKHLERAKTFLENQVNITPPYNTPWSFFDLAEISMFLEDEKGSFINNIKKGLNYTTDDWQIETFLNSLKLLEDVTNTPEYFEKGIELLSNSLNK